MAIHSNNSKLVELLLFTCNNIQLPIDVTIVDLKGVTPLLLAIQSGNIDMVKLLLQQIPSNELNSIDQVNNCSH